MRVLKSPDSTQQGECEGEGCESIELQVSCYLVTGEHDGSLGMQNM